MPFPPPDRQKIVFVVTEDWFFASHFLPMARAARDMCLDVGVVTRVRDSAAAIEATGARVIALEAERRSLSPFAAASAVIRIAAILRKERPAIVHCIALKPILVGGAAARLAGIGARVYALTGLGFIGAKRDLVGRTARAGIKAVIRGPLETPETRYLFENEDDPALLGLDPASPRVTVIGGAGVDPALFPHLPLPPGKTLRIALVSRMLWSKGVDLAVEATRRARDMGADVSLSLYGEPDPSNPKAIPASQLIEWSEQDGVEWHGATREVGAVWRDHHVACLPSRGGEGLPRTLLEAAACGRAIVTTDVAGCRDFVREGKDGRVVAAGDAGALAAAFVDLAGRRDDVAAMGRSARRRLISAHTEEHVKTAVQRLYAELLGRSGSQATFPGPPRPIE